MQSYQKKSWEPYFILNWFTILHFTPTVRLRHHNVTLKYFGQLFLL